MSARHTTCKWSLRNIKIIKLYKYNAYHNHSQRITLNLALPRHHLGEFGCNKCKKSFGQKASLLVHRRRHSNVKPYKCGKCNKRFITRSGLYIHRTSHNIKQVKTEQNNTVSKYIRGQRSQKSRKIRVISRNSVGQEKASELFNKNITKSNRRSARKGSNSNKMAHTNLKNKVTEMVKDSLCPVKNVLLAKVSKRTESSANISDDDNNSYNEPINNDDSDSLSGEKSPPKEMSPPKESSKRMVTRMQGKRKEPPVVKKRGRKPKVLKSKTKTVNSVGKNSPKDQHDDIDQKIKEEVNYSDEDNNMQKFKTKQVKKEASKDDTKPPGESAKRNRIYQCDYCSKMCYDASQLRSHRRLHTGEKPFVCKVCNKGFRMNACLNVHMRVHTGEMPFHCSTCSKDFRYQNTFNKHLATHQPDVEKQVKCKVCGRLFLTRESLWDHKQKLRKCDNCSEFFCSFAALNIHKHKTHVDSFSVSKADGKFCQFCNKKFNSNYTYFVHMQKHARKGMPIKFPCPVCTESFGTYDELRVHRKTHTIPREKCVTCPWSHCCKKLTSQTRLNSHLKRHNGETQYLCSRCGMTFTDCVFYLKHRRSCYQKVTKYACSWCGKVLSGHSALQKHILSHKGEKPCQCEVCGARFNNSSHLKRHKRIHIRKGEMPPFEESTGKATQTVESILCYPDVLQSQDYAEYTVEIGNEQVVAYFINKESEQVELKPELLCATESVGKAVNEAQ